MNRYDMGDIIRLTATFTNSAGTVVDPSSVYFKYRPGTSTATTWGYGVNSVVKAATGNYYADVAVDSSGLWTYRWEGKGANAAAVEGVFEVRFSDVLN